MELEKDLLPSPRQGVKTLHSAVWTSL